MRLSISDAKHGRGGVMSDAWQLQRLFHSARKLAAMTGHDLLCRSMQVARAAVIAEASPRAQHGFAARSSERVDVRKARQESAVVWEHSGNACLLQHDFGNPHAVGIPRSAPVEVALCLGEPAEQLRLKSRQPRGRNDFAFWSGGRAPRKRG